MPSAPELSSWRANKPIIDSERRTTELGELIADDKALDLGAWVDAPVRLPAKAVADRFLSHSTGCPLKFYEQLTLFVS